MFETACFAMNLDAFMPGLRKASDRYRSYPRAKSFLYIWNMNYQEFIEIRTDKRFGKPCIKGTRISVYDVLNWLSNGMSKQEIVADFSELTDEMISACLAFAADKEHKLRVASWNYSSIKISLQRLLHFWMLNFQGRSKWSNWVFTMLRIQWSLSLQKIISFQLSHLILTL